MWFGLFGQDDSYLESYISTIGVDFVSYPLLEITSGPINRTQDLVVVGNSDQNMLLAAGSDPLFGDCIDWPINEIAQYDIFPEVSALVFCCIMLIT